MAKSQVHVRLTRRIVEAAEILPTDQFIWDTDVTGFGVRIHPGGHRGYFLQYRFAGRTRRYQIGGHGTPWTVETARDRARILMGQVAAGEDPQEAKAGARSELTVAQLCASTWPKASPAARRPAFRVRRFPEKKLERFLSPAEIGRLGEALAAAEPIGVEPAAAIAAIRLLILTGCRKNEVLTLQRSHVDAHHRCPRLPDSKTGAKIVHVGLPALKVIEAIPEVLGNPYVLVGNWDVGHFVNLQRPWERIRAAASLEDVRLHDLRHAFASLGAATGDSLLVIGALLGHRSAKTTHRYAHPAEHPVKDAADRISAEMSRLLGVAGEVAAAAAEPLMANVSAFEAAQAQTLLGKVSQTRWLPTQAAAAYLGLSAPTLQTYRWSGVGPVSRKIGRRVVYAQFDLDEWIDARAGAAAV